VGVINVKGANGAEATANINADGTYSIDVTNLTANYILYAQGTVNGKSIKIYSTAVAEGNINITPITDLIVANAYKGLPGDAYNNWNGTQVSATSLSTAQAQVQSDLAPLLVSAGVSTTTDLMSANFSANGTGLDKALDYLKITYNETTATVTNTATGSSYSNDVTNPGTSTGLPSSDTSQTTAVMTDADGINVFWQKINTLWATSKPSATTISSQLGPLVASDLLDSGTTDKATWLANFDPGVGIKLSAAIAAPMTGTPYQKAYWVTVTVSGSGTGSATVAMVFDGTNWLFYGDRRWVNSNLQAFSQYTINADGTTWEQTGFWFELDDTANYAHNYGVQSAVVTGPGLPARGVVMKSMWPNTRFYEDIPNGYMWHIISDDATIGAIPDNSTYTVNFYTQATGSLTGSETPVSTFSVIIPKRPLKNSENVASVYPTFTSPTSHALSAANLGGKLTASWTNVPTMNVDFSDQYVADNSGNQDWFDVNIAPGATTVTSDTSGLSFTSTICAFGLWGHDSYQRLLSYTWVFQGGGSATNSLLVGTWYSSQAPLDNTTIVATFIDSSRFMYIEYSNDGTHPADSQDGIEFGTYVSAASTMTPSLVVDTNGGWGFSNLVGGATYLITGNTLTFGVNGQSSSPLTKIASSATNPLVGSWYFSRSDGHTGVLTFVNDSSFVYAEYGPNDPDSWPGMERGTYTATANSVTFTVAEDTNGGWGMSSLGGAATPISISGNTLTISPIGGGGQAFTRVQ
jgi:hypothetical protein